MEIPHDCCHIFSKHGRKMLFLMKLQRAFNNNSHSYMLYFSSYMLKKKLKEKHYEKFNSSIMFLGIVIV